MLLLDTRGKDAACAFVLGREALVKMGVFLVKKLLIELCVLPADSAEEEALLSFGVNISLPSTLRAIASME